MPKTSLAVAVLATLFLGVSADAAEFKTKAGRTIKGSFVDEAIRLETPNGVVEVNASAIAAFSPLVAIHYRGDVVSGDAAVTVAFPPLIFKDVRLKDGKRLSGKMAGSSLTLRSDTETSTFSVGDLESYRPDGQSASIKVSPLLPFTLQRAAIRKILDDQRSRSQPRGAASDQLLDALLKEGSLDPEVVVE